MNYTGRNGKETEARLQLGENKLVIAEAGTAAAPAECGTLGTSDQPFSVRRDNPDSA